MTTTWKTRLKRIKEWQGDAIIIRDSAEHIHEVLALGLPTITACNTQNEFPGSPSIIDDCASAGIMAAEHFLDRGFRNFAYCGFDGMQWSRERCNSFSKRVAEAGFETHIYRQPESKAQRSWEKEPDYIAKWLRLLPKPLALMTCADHRSKQAVEACRIAGLEIPYQVAILGVDNDELLCELSTPPLSSVAINYEKGGYTAAELLDRMMARNFKDLKQQILLQASHIIPRHSTDVLAIDDTEVAKAIRFIRQQARKQIQVRDVVNATSLSRRQLYQRFQRHMGRSILSEIKRARVAKIAKALSETNLTVTQIASDFGFSSSDHVARYFRSQMKMSPSEYRRLLDQN